MEQNCVKNSMTEVVGYSYFYGFKMVLSKVREWISPSPVREEALTVRWNQWLRFVKIKRENMCNCSHTNLSLSLLHILIITCFNISFPPTQSTTVDADTTNCDSFFLLLKQYRFENCMELVMVICSYSLSLSTVIHPSYL
jgi:hypothetical protein